MNYRLSDHSSKKCAAHSGMPLIDDTSLRCLIDYIEMAGEMIDAHIEPADEGL